VCRFFWLSVPHSSFIFRNASSPTTTRFSLLFLLWQIPLASFPLPVKVSMRPLGLFLKQTRQKVYPFPALPTLILHHMLAGRRRQPDFASFESSCPPDQASSMSFPFTSLCHTYFELPLRDFCLEFPLCPRHSFFLSPPRLICLEVDRQGLTPFWNARFFSISFVPLHGPIFFFPDDPPSRRIFQVFPFTFVVQNIHIPSTLEVSQQAP